MTQTSGWKVLNAGQGGDLVLAVDFATTGRSDSGFSDLVPQLDQGLTVWETRQPNTAGSAEDYLGLWLGEVEASGRPVKAVLGYCAGSVFAGELARRIGAKQAQAPRLVLFEPEVPAPDSLYRDFADMMNQFASVLSDEEVSAAQQKAVAAQKEAADFDAYGAALVDIFMEQAGVAFAREELDTEMLDEFAAVFRIYVSYLSGARELGADAWSAGTAVVSSTPCPGAATAAERIEVPVDHADLLRNAKVAQIVTELVNA